MSASVKPRLAGRQPSNRGGVPRVMTRLSSRLQFSTAVGHTASAGPWTGPQRDRWRAVLMSTPEDPTANWSFETKQVHAGPDARQRDQRAGAADLPDHVVHVQQHRARRRPVRARRARQHLHPDQEPDQRRRRAAHRRTRRRGRGAVPGVRPGRRDVRDPQPRQRGRPHRVQPAALRRHVQPVPLHAAQARHRGQLRREPRRPGFLAGGRAAEHQGVLRRDDLQPAERHPRHPRRRGGRPRRRACR